ncbi:MAG: hypothetical protein PV344_04160, partial [Anaplasma sp.]|nr:hypothetical protein [Anaplasma sp.]
WNAIALSGLVRIAFSFASHALESHNGLVLKTPRFQAVQVDSVSRSPPEGRGFKTGLKCLKFLFKAN